MKDSCTKAVWPTISKVRPLTVITETEFAGETMIFAPPIELFCKVEAKCIKTWHSKACSTDIDGHATIGGSATSIHLYLPL
jgi:hypothetical protein